MVKGKRKCPYCSHAVGYEESKIPGDDIYHKCTSCNNKIVYFLEIYPGNEWGWDKPYNPVND